MDVDECMAAASSGLNLANDVLSPPASNERVDQFSQVRLIVVSGVLSVPVELVWWWPESFV